MVGKNLIVLELIIIKLKNKIRGRTVNKSFSIVISLILSLFISTIILGVIYTVLSNLRDTVQTKETAIVEQKILSINEIKKNHYNEYQISKIKCIRETDKSLEECYQAIEHQFNPLLVTEKNTTNINSKSNFLINIIYGIIFLSLFTQLMIFFLKSNNRTAFYISEFNLNAPATLGILGTILSFAILANMSKDGNIQSLFLANFFNAVITTALGVTVYIINLFLNIYIAPRIDFKT